LMFALNFTAVTQIHCGNYAIAKAQSAKVIALADEKSASFWNAFGILERIPVTWKRSLHVGSNWRTLAD
jgi:hypothetical protein